MYGAGRLAGLPAFEEGIARAQAGGPSTVLVSVFLDGGADSLSILAPTGDPNYRRLRPNLAIAENGNSFSEDPRLTWHPAAAPLARLHGEGKVTVMPAVGYDSPDQSHFVSRHFWEVGALDAQLRSGWLGRVLDRVGTPDNPLAGDLARRLAGSVAGRRARAGRRRSTRPRTSASGRRAPGARRATWRSRRSPTSGALWPARAIRRSRRPPAPPRSRVRSAPRWRRSATTASRPTRRRPTYPGGEDRFPRRLAGLAAMLARRAPGPLRDALGAGRLGHARRPGRRR